MNFIQEFLNALTRIKNDETAFVIVNTKAEQYLLQRIAYEIHKKHRNLGFNRVAIEYTDNKLSFNRTDLTIIKDKEPIIALEAKYQYRHDKICTKQKDRKQYIKDLDKLKKLNIESYFALFIVHFEPEYPHFKYSQPNKNKEKINRSALETIFENYRPPFKENIGTIGIYQDEKYKNIEVKLEVWIYKIN